MKLARKAKKEKKRQLEEERLLRETKAKEETQKQIDANNPLSIFGGESQNMSPNKLKDLLRGSTNSMNKADYDQRSQNMLNCMRKFFEEARTQRI